MRIKFALFAMAALALASAAQAAVILDTGVGNAPWTTQVDLSPIPGGWYSPTAPSKWVGQTATDGDPNVGAAPGVYVYTLALGTYGTGPGTFSLTYVVDDSIVWSISDGGTLAGADTCGPNCWSSIFGAPYTLTGTYSATSVLTATVTNNGTLANPTGLLVQGLATSNSEVPEPSTYAMVAIGAVGVLVARRRRA